MLAPVETAHDLATDPDGVHLVAGQEIGQTGHPGVHGGAAQLLVGRFLAGGHLDQGRAAQKDLGPLLDHDDVVAHAGDVGTPGGGVAEDDGHRRQGGSRAPGQIPERPSPGDEQLGLRRQVGPTRLHQVDDGEPVLEGDVGGPGPLPEGKGVHGPAPHGGVVGGDEALHALDHADPDDRRRPDRVLGAPRRQGGELEEGGVAVEEQLDALTGQELAPVTVPLHIAFAASGPGRRQLLVHALHRLFEGALVGPEGRRVGVDVGGEGGHGVDSLLGGGAGGRCGLWLGGAPGPPGRIAPADVGRIGPMSFLPHHGGDPSPEEDGGRCAPW